MAEVTQVELTPTGTLLPVAENRHGTSDHSAAGTVRRPLQNERTSPLPPPPLRSAKEEERIVDITNALADMTPGQPRREAVITPSITPELLRYSEGGRDLVYPDTEIAERIRIVKEGLLPQDKDGRVVTVGGVCRQALQELEAAAGDPDQWTKDDLQRADVTNLLRVYQGFEDLLQNRTMRGPQTRAIQHIVGRQQQMDRALEHGSSSKEHEQVAAIANAIGQGIGEEETPYDTILKDTVYWAGPEFFRDPQAFARWFRWFKNAPGDTDDDRFYKVKVTDVTPAGGGHGRLGDLDALFNTRTKESAPKLKNVIQVIWALLASFLQKNQTRSR